MYIFKINLGGKFLRFQQVSGVTSLIKSVMMLRQNVIPPHVGIKGRINHRLPPLEITPVRLAMNNVKWPRRVGDKRRILINNFDAAVSSRTKPST
jgi:acyl transferase domain-containing protein